MLTVAIQAGGESRRMGRDKALMDFLGEPLIVRAIRRLSPIADEIIVTTNTPDSYRFLGLPLFPDLKPGRGALGGLYTALVSAKNPLVAVVACDMPFASPSLLTFGYDQLTQSGDDVAIAEAGDGFLEPLHAIYRRETGLPAIEKAIAADKWKVIAWFPDVKVRVINKDEVSRFDPEHLAFLNLNTPEELAAAEEIARKHNE
jgi:molybdopterin-guanine dinucleotide biosynthesis protein A